MFFFKLVLDTDLSSAVVSESVLYEALTPQLGVRWAGFGVGLGAGVFQSAVVT